MRACNKRTDKKANADNNQPCEPHAFSAWDGTERDAFGGNWYELTEIIAKPLPPRSKICGGGPLQCLSPLIPRFKRSPDFPRYRLAAFAPDHDGVIATDSFRAPARDSCDETWRFLLSKVRDLKAPDGFTSAPHDFHMNLMAITRALPCRTSIVKLEP